MVRYLPDTHSTTRTVSVRPLQHPTWRAIAAGACWPGAAWAAMFAIPIPTLARILVASCVTIIVAVIVWWVDFRRGNDPDGAAQPETPDEPRPSVHNLGTFISEGDTFDGRVKNEPDATFKSRRSRYRHREDDRT